MIYFSTSRVDNVVLKESGLDLGMYGLWSCLYLMDSITAPNTQKSNKLNEKKNEKRYTI